MITRIFRRRAKGSVAPWEKGKIFIPAAIFVDKEFGNLTELVEVGRSLEVFSQIATRHSKKFDSALSGSSAALSFG